MYFKRLTAQATAIAITCASSVVYADANYSQRAKEQAERAAAAAAIAADQLRLLASLSQSRHHRVQKPALHQRITTQQLRLQRVRVPQLLRKPRGPSKQHKQIR